MIKALWGIIVLSGILLTGCAPRTSPPAAQLLVEQPVTAATGETWQEEWDKTLKAAQKEGKLVVYTSSGGETRAELSRTFDKKFGIATEYVSARGPELTTKLSQERRAGLYLADVYLNGTYSSMVDMKPAGMFDPLDRVLILPEVTNPKLWYGGNLNWIDSGHHQVAILADFTYPLVINTDLVKPDEVKSYNDLLKPKFSGKMLLNDPTVAGSGASLTSALGWEIMGLSWLRQLAEQKPEIVRDYRLGTEWLARGKYQIGIGLKSDIILNFAQSGAPLKEIMPIEGSYITAGPGAVSLMNKAPHPRAARVYINWILSKEGATLFSRINGAQSARVDVPTDFLTIVRDSQGKYFSASREEVSLQREARAKEIKDIFGPLLKK